MTTEYYLISEPTGLSAEEIERATGLRASYSPLGVMLEKPKPFDMHRTMNLIDRALHPDRCTCGAQAILHRPGCPAANYVT